MTASLCAVSRTIVFLAQPGRTQKEVLGSPTFVLAAVVVRAEATSKILTAEESYAISVARIRTRPITVSLE